MLTPSLPYGAREMTAVIILSIFIVVVGGVVVVCLFPRFFLPFVCLLVFSRLCHFFEQLAQHYVTCHATTGIRGGSGGGGVTLLYLLACQLIGIAAIQACVVTL